MCFNFDSPKPQPLPAQATEPKLAVGRDAQTEQRRRLLASVLTTPRGVLQGANLGSTMLSGSTSAAAA